MKKSHFFIVSYSMILEKCEMTINSSCHTAMPMPDQGNKYLFYSVKPFLIFIFRQGLVDTCTKATDDFAKKATECMDMSLRSMNASCACWSSEEMRTLSTAVTGCKINETAAIAKGLKKCQDDFRKCRKYEDASIATISTCSVDTELVKMKAASLAQNKEKRESKKTIIVALFTIGPANPEFGPTFLISLVHASPQIAINSVTCWWCNYFGAVCPSGCVAAVTGKRTKRQAQAQTCSGLIALVAERKYSFSTFLKLISDI